MIKEISCKIPAINESLLCKFIEGKVPETWYHNLGDIPRDRNSKPPGIVIHNCPNLKHPISWACK